MGEGLSLMEMMATINQHFAALRAEQTSDREAALANTRALEERITALGATPAITTSPLVTPEEGPPTQDRPPKKKATLPDPPRFEGARRKFPAWYLEMENKLLTDGEAIGSSRDQFSYIFSRLEDNPRAMSTTFAAMGGHDGNHDPNAFMQYLVSCYGDPNLKQRALGRLGDLTQGAKESFASFLPKFEKELADSGGAHWSSDVQINFLRGSLNSDLEELLLAQTSLPKDYRGFVEVVQQLGTNLDNKRFRGRKKGTTPNVRNLSSEQTGSGRNKAQTNPDTMDWEPTKISKAIQRQNKDLVGKRAKWVTREEREKRREEGRCLRCGRTSCKILDCPLLPARPPSSSANAGRSHVKKAKPITRASVEEDDSEDGSSSEQSESEGEELKE